MSSSAQEGDRWPRVIAHVDMDAFYAAVEVLDHPELRGQPLVIGGRGRAGIVTTASYEARRFGIHSAMPMFKALERCPHALVLPARLDRYREVSARLMRLLERFSPQVRASSLDEAALDLSGTAHLFGPPAQAAESIRAAIREELGLTASVGVAAGRIVAKIASDWRKPDGLTVVPPEETAAFLAPLSVRRVPGVGPKMAERLERLNLRTLADVQATDLALLRRAVGPWADRFQRLALGEDHSAIPEPTPRRTVGAERTFRDDLSRYEDLIAILQPLADRVARELRDLDLEAAGVRLKLKTRTFQSLTREARLAEPTQSAETMLRTLSALLRAALHQGPFRLAGITATALRSPEDGHQLSLLADPSSPASHQREEDVANVLDAVQRRFGEHGLRRASRLPGVPRKDS